MMTQTPEIPRRQWEGPTGLGLVAAFLLLGMPYLLIGHVTSLQPGHAVFVVLVTLGLWVSSSGLRRGDLKNRSMSLPVLLFFLAAVALLALREIA